MGEPARKLTDIEPDIRPKFYDINPEEGDAARIRDAFHDINEAESNPEVANKDESLYEKESNGTNVAPEEPSWKVNRSENGIPKQAGFKAFAKKRGPLIGIIITIFGGGAGLLGMTAGAGVLFQFVATSVGHWNTQLASMDARTISLYTDKTTSGFACGTVISIACKYSTMSDTQISNFEDAGITVNPDGKTLFGRTKPASFEFNGETIEANNFKSAIKSNPDFAEAVETAYNPKFAGFSDNVFVNWVEQKLGINKAAENLEGTTDAEQLSSLKSEINPAADTPGTLPDVGENNPATNEPYTQAEIEALKEASGDISSESAAIAEMEEATGDTAIAEAEAIAAKTGWSAVDAISVLGYTHAACAVYSSVQALGFAAKTVRSQQLDKLGWALMKQDSKARVGDATEANMRFWGDYLTTQTKDENGNMTSATDSYGYKVSSYGVAGAGAMPTSTTRYLAGGGLTGKLLSVTSSLNSMLYNAPKKTCGIVNNPIVIGGSLALGVASLVIPFVREGRLPELTWQTGAVIALYTASYALPHMLKDIVAGVVVDSKTTGAAAGDALTSGISGIMSKTAQAGGNAPLTPTQAVAYNEYSSDVAAKYEAHERLAYSPLDPTRSSTFMGKIMAALTPYVSKLSSLSGIIKSIASVTSTSLASITSPVTKAASTSDYTQCQDEDYKALGVATDPFCNVSYGIPPSALTTDPIKVADTLVKQGQIDPESGEPTGTEYKTFVSNCIERDTTKNPLGDMGATSTLSNGQECLFGKQVKKSDGSDAGYTNDNFYIHHIDQRVQADMDGADVGTRTATTSTDTSGWTPVVGSIAGAPTICVDAGHPPDGAPGESKYTLTAAKALQTELTNRGYKVIMTRTDSGAVSIQARPKKCLDNKADFMFSIHGENDGPVSGHPFMLYMRDDGPRPRKLSSVSKADAGVIQKAMVASLGGSHGAKGTLGLKPENYGDHDYLGIFSGADKGGMPAVLSEVVRSNNDGSSAIDDPVYLKKLVTGIANGIQELFPIKSTSISRNFPLL